MKNLIRTRYIEGQRSRAKLQATYLTSLKEWMVKQEQIILKCETKINLCIKRREVVGNHGRSRPKRYDT